MTFRLESLAAVVLMAFALAAPPAAAQEKDSPGLSGGKAAAGSARAQTGALSPDDRAALKRVEDYLNGIRTLSATFRQVDSAGRRASGRLYVDKPGRLRFEYDPPVPILIVANGRFLIHYDRDLKTASYVSQQDTPAWLLSAPKVELQGNVTATDVARRDGKLLVSLVKAADPGEGQVTLVLNESPMRLEQWLVTDPHGVTTTVQLEEVRVGAKVDPDLFKFDEPVWHQQSR